MPNEPSAVYLTKLRMAEDLAARLQRQDYKTRGNYDKLNALLKEGLDYVRANDVTLRLRRADALEKSCSLLDRVNSVWSSDADHIFAKVHDCARVARTGRGML